MFASTNFTEIWKLIDEWLLNEQKTGKVETSSVATYQTKTHFYAIVFFIKFPR